MFSTFDHRLAEATPREFEYTVARGSVLAGLFGAPRHRLGRYELDRALGEGAYGTVFAGRDLDLDRPVAVKVLDVSAMRVRLSEAQAMARVAHPNVVEVYDVGYQGDTMYIVMEVVEGATLAVWLQSKRTPAEILDMFIDAGRGMIAAHQSGLVHRDFKPANVMIASGVAKVTDFGLAVAGPRGGTGLAHPVAGTPMYMAPEQHRGAQLDARADQYAYCVALWEAWLGTPPFEGHTVEALLEAKQCGPPSVRPGAMPRRLYAILRRGLAVAPEGRFESMQELVRALERVGTEDSRSARMGAVGIAALLAAWGLSALGEHDESPQVPSAQPMQTEASRGADPEVRAVIEAARFKPPQAALVMIDELLADVRTHADPSALPELISTRGEILLKLDRTQDAVDSFTEAYFLVSQTGERPAAALRAATELAYVHGVRERRPDEGSRWMSIAHSLLPQVGDRPQLRSRVLATQASLDAERGAASEALAGFRESLALCEPSGSCDEGFVASTRGNYASALLDAGDVDQAIVALEELVEDLSRRLGPDHVEVGTTLNRLGAAMVYRGDHTAATRHYQRALEIFETHLGPEHRDTLTVVAGLGQVAQLQGDLEQARARYQRVAQSLGDEQDVKRADILNNLGVIALELDDLDDAVNSYQKAIDAYTVALGRTHPHVGIALFGLGYAHLQRGEPERAIEALEEALAIAELDDETAGRRPSVTRLWLAQALLAAGVDPQRPRALLERAAAGFEALGESAADNLQETRDALAKLE